MNKQELIKTLMKRMEDFGYFPSFTNVKIFIREYEKLTNSEPQKPVVPQFVADLIEYAKDHDWDLEDTFQDIAGEADDSNIYQWYYTKSENMDTFARAWLDGYEVEKEKRYRISMPKARNYNNKVQFLCEKDGKMFWCAECQRFKTKFTQKELEDSNFGWLFNCEGVEVEEVEDDSEI